MGGLTSAVDWWEESQMRVLVLGSLVVQFLLLISTYLRTRAIPGWIRFIIWLAYLGGDAIAIYALATLFNRHKDQDRGGKRALEVVWAPILLLHLGGNDGITAYNIEDNELWTRHLLTVVSQVTVAIYVFSKSWRGGDKRLLQAAIVLFVPGVLICFAKPWALKRASIKSLVSSPSAQSTRQKTKDEGQQNEGEMDTFKRYVNRALRVFLRFPVDERDDLGHVFRHERSLNLILQDEVYKLCVDLSSPYPLRLNIFSDFRTHSSAMAYCSVREGLGRAFFFLYTKAKAAGMGALLARHAKMSSSLSILVGFLVSYSRMYLPWAAIGLFHHSHREAYSDIDVKITYALLCCTSVLEFVSPAVFLLALKSAQDWPEMVAQYNLIEYFVRNKNHSNVMWIARRSGCKDFLDQHWCMESCFSSGTIAELVLHYLKAGWNEKIHDPVSYRKFNDNRGQWALEIYEDELGWSIKGAFDKSVLLWHIATDFCFFLSPFSEHIRVCEFAKVPSTWQSLLASLDMDENEPIASKNSGSENCDKRLAMCKAVQCRQMSNYMVYLLFVNPEMLLPGTRRNLFTAAYSDLKYILKDKLMSPHSSSQQLEERELVETLINTMRDKSNKEDRKTGSEENLIDDAWDLAQGLLNIGDDKMWDVIQRVWVEMLCFSASRCRGYLHAKALGSGGEFLSYVWLLMFCMGMETFSERLQREELPNWEANNNGAPLPSEAHSGVATTSSSSEVYNMVSPSAENHIIGDELV